MPMDLNHVTRTRTLARGESERCDAKLDDCPFSAGTNKVMMTANTPSENPLNRSGLALRRRALLSFRGSKTGCQC